jgi:hypothetical protein
VTTFRAPGPRRSGDAGGGRGAWAFRLIVLSAFAATVWFAGPTAWRRVGGWLGDGAAARTSSTETSNAETSNTETSSSATTVDPRRVQAVSGPRWMGSDYASSLLRELDGVTATAPDFDLRDLAAVEAFRKTLTTLPFASGVEIERLRDGRVRAYVTLRRPELELRTVSGGAFATVDAHGVLLPPVGGEDGDLPACELPDGTERVVGAVVQHGERFPDDRVVAAAAVAHEWRVEFSEPARAANIELPALGAVDASNLGLMRLPAPWSEVLVGLERGDGRGLAWFAYGRAPDDPRERVSIAVKRRVLMGVLKLHPGLRGVQRGDLRMENTWRDWIGED